MKNFNEVYREHSGYVFNFLNNRLYNSDSDLAKDLTQDTFIKVSNNLHKFDGDKSSMRTWIVTIAKNVLIDNNRKRKINTQSMNNFIDEEGRETFQVHTNTTPLTDIVNTQLGEGVQLAFNKLPDAYRQFAELFFNKQLSYDEIANQLNIPLGTVKGGIFRTRELLRETLKAVRS